jgi:hypothetical protein
MTRTIAFTVGLSALLALVGCYNTNNVKNGGLVCGTAGSCPDGFVCSDNKGMVASAGHCWRNGTGPTDSGTDQACALPYGPFATCSTSQINLASTNSASTCDPVCQSGCPCNHRCILDDQTNNAFLCEASTVPVGTSFIPPLGACNGASQGLCAPGSVCINDSICQNVCYRTCRTDEDCGNSSRCTDIAIYDNSSQPVPGLFLCSPPIEQCNPTGSATCAPARANFNCVFLAGLTGVGKDASTVCDCGTSRVLEVGQKCQTALDNCKPGTVCVNGYCHTVCNMEGSGSPCTNGGGCTAIYGSQTYGYCNK